MIAEKASSRKRFRLTFPVMLSRLVKQEWGLSSWIWMDMVAVWDLEFCLAWLELNIGDHQSVARLYQGLWEVGKCSHNACGGECQQLSG